MYVVRVNHSLKKASQPIKVVGREDWNAAIELNDSTMQQLRFQVN